MLINGFNSWRTGFGNGRTTFITAGMIINVAIFLRLARYIPEIAKRFLQNCHMNLDVRLSFFRFLVSRIVFFFQPLTGLSDAVRVGREAMSLVF